MYFEFTTEDDFQRAHTLVRDVLTTAHASGRIRGEYTIGTPDETRYSTPESNMNQVAWEIVSLLARSGGPGCGVSGDVADLADVQVDKVSMFG